MEDSLIKRVTSKHIFFIILLLLITIGIRLPFLRKNINFNNDAPIYSRNIEKKFFSGSYDVQMPGYVSYIYVGRTINFFVKNTVVTQHIINIILLGFISWAMYFLFIRLNFSKTESLLFTIFYSFNNILLLGSITGGNRLFLTLTSIVLIYFSIIIIEEEKYLYLLWFSVFFAFMIGFRQDLSIDFLPLYIYLLVKSKNSRVIIFSLLLFALICISWFVPLILEYGGIKKYLMTTHNSTAVSHTSLIFSGVTLSSVLNVVRIFIYLFNASLFFLPIFFYNLIRKRINIPKMRITILLYALIPALLLQMLVHNGNFVHLTAFFTPLFIIFIYNFKINFLPRFVVSGIIIIAILFQFFVVGMFKRPNLYQKIANTVWLQYSYDGVKSGKTLALKEIKDDLNK